MPPIIPLPEPVVGWAISIFAVGALVYKLIDGVKNLIPGLKDNPTFMKILNFTGNFLMLGAGCFVLGQVHDLFDVLKCLGAAVMGSLVAAGLYEAKKNSDLARAGGAAALVNTKAVAEVEAGEPLPGSSKKNGK